MNCATVIDTRSPCFMFTLVNIIVAVDREGWNAAVYTDGSSACTQFAPGIVDGNGESSKHFLVSCEFFLLFFRILV